MSKLETNTVDSISGTSTLTLGGSNASVVSAGTEVRSNKLSPASGTALQIGDSGDTITIPSGATITNNGTQTGFGGTNTPSFRVRTSSVQTFSSGYVKVQYDAKEWDTDSVFDHTTNYRFTVPSGKAGKYHITIYHRQNGTSAQALLYGIVLYKNGGGYRYHNASPTFGSNVERYGITYTETIELAVNDYLEVYINGSGFELGAGSGIFMAHKLIGV